MVEPGLRPTVWVLSSSQTGWVERWKERMRARSSGGRSAKGKVGGEGEGEVLMMRGGRVDRAVPC